MGAVVGRKCLLNSDHYAEFGSVTGKNNGVEAYLNCDVCFNGFSRSNYLPTEKTGLNKEIYSGSKWQCVEYARRWLYFNNNCIFGSVGVATSIFELDFVEDLKSNTNRKFISYKNGCSTPPQFGDLIIFPRDGGAWFGHVAVITNVNLENNYYEIAEQNYDNRWEDPNSYSRRLLLIKQNDNYILTEFKWRKGLLNIDNHQLNELSKREISKVIGFKRILL